MPEQGVALDTETHQIQPGLLAPPLVCGSVALLDVDALTAAEYADQLEREGRPDEAAAIRGRPIIEGELLSKDDVLELFLRILRDSSKILVGANIAYDLLVLAVAWEARGVDVMPDIFRAFTEERIYDLQIAEALHAVAHGHLGINPRSGKPLINRETGRRGMYSLDNCVELVLGRVDAKEHDVYRRRYAEFEFVPIDQWPREAREYPVDDARNTMETALAQCGHLPKVSPHHDWGEDGCTICGVDRPGELCVGKRPHRNLHDHAAQVFTAFCLHLGAAWGFHVDQRKVGIVEQYAIRKRAAGISPFKEAGIIRADGSVNERALKTLVARAYGAGDPCSRCGGSGKIPSPNPRQLQCKECRGRSAPWKSGGELRAPTVAECATCGNTGKVPDPRHVVGCTGESGEITCDGTGLTLTAALPRSDTGRIGKGGDALHESGNELLMSYGDFIEDAKWTSSYTPYLRQGRRGTANGDLIDVPLTLRPNPVLETGRVSYGGVIQLFPRWPGFLDKDTNVYVPSFRECLVARKGFLFSSEDFKAGELITHAQSCRWINGFSSLGDVLLSKDRRGKPMDPHAMLAATVMGVGYDELNENLKVISRYKDARQASKCFHPDTEVLTRSGWVNIGDLTYEHEVAAANPGADGIVVEWQKPTALTRRPSPGSLIHLRNEGMDLRVTDDHRMLVRGGSGKWSVVTPEEVPTARSWYNAGNCAAGTWRPDERILRLAVATQADGSYRYLRIAFGFKKARKIERLRGLLRVGEYVETTTSQGATQFVLTREISAQIREFLDADKQFTWRWLDLTPELRALVLDELKHWDGHQQLNWRMSSYCSARRINVDVIQAMASITGRKSRAVNRGRQEAHHNDMWSLSLRAKANTRGENLSVTRMAYQGDVVCLSVPASFVIVRDGGVPVVVGQCFNFGKPGGMGDVTLVLQQRKQGPDTPHPTGPVWIEDENGNLVRGYKGLRFCLLMGGDGPCGKRKLMSWKERPIPPVCAECLERAEWLGGRWKAQWPENRGYFRFAQDCVERGQLITADALERWPHLQTVFSPGQRLAPGEIMQHVSGRVRGGLNFTAAANSWFQGLLADITKAAYRQATMECYVRGYRVPDMLFSNSVRSKYAGLDSPLYGSRIPGFFHDELFGEHPRDQAADAAWRTSEVLRDTMRWYCPDLADAAEAEPTLMECWDKRAAKVIHRGKLVPWTREHDPKTCSECAV